MRKIELLAPAKNADIGIEAIRHGADAVYIGASEFGARAAAGNDIAEIARLVEFAHLYKAKVYVTVNTIIYDDELAEVERMIWDLYNVHVDALIVQDFGILGMNLPPIPLHASTQMDNRSVDKVRFLRDCGFEQVVLARELTPVQISQIHDAVPDVSLEVFVHGAMCVSYSGQCYASEAIFGRSANRGECAQLCRMDYDLVSRPRIVDGHNGGGNEHEKVLVHNKKLLSIKDNCQINNLEKLLMAGASSFKIEGRLKDVDYVKNITADYSRQLDEVIARHPNEFTRASVGRVELNFTPNWQKSFFRGFEFQAKSVGEYIGKVKDVFTNHFVIGYTALSKSDAMRMPEMHNGDGVCILDSHDNIIGFRINRVEGDRLFPLEMPKGLKKGMPVYRNQDHKFEQLLSKSTATRRIPVDITMDETAEGFVLVMSDVDGNEVKLDVKCEKELARSHQLDNIKRQLAKLGDTPFVLDNLTINYKKNW
ncbi:MAG: U32 family peptidase, partial [Bacteroidaceae bacterium]|nr:U32 family peptidase [Bacteroidaceae bacterium]